MPALTQFFTTEKKAKRSALAMLETRRDAGRSERGRGKRRSAAGAARESGRSKKEGWEEGSVASRRGPGRILRDIPQERHTPCQKKMFSENRRSLSITDSKRQPRKGEFFRTLTGRYFETVIYKDFRFRPKIVFFYCASNNVS